MEMEDRLSHVSEVNPDNEDISLMELLFSQSVVSEVNPDNKDISLMELEGR